MPVEPCPYFRPRLALNGCRIGGDLRVHDAFQFGAMRGEKERQPVEIFDKFGLGAFFLLQLVQHI